MALATDIMIDEAAIYVGTYRKYNEGSLYGKWLSLSDYADKEEFYKACAELHKDERDPEFMFQDYENIPDSLVGECWISERFFEIRDELVKMTEDEARAFYIWCSNGHHDLSSESIDGLISQFQDDYVGQYASEVDFAWELVAERTDINAFVHTYFDYEAYAWDIFRGDYWFEDGYVFNNS
ncbi:antirestriction protein ArdA [Elizabethkingia anophelis]|uniref:antirestriction protein ArdA n=1 Tax=Elizabethkingia anophelis TaxID=1117645 RepID=UPI0038913F37